MILTSRCICGGWVLKELFFFRPEVGFTENGWITWFFVLGAIFACWYDRAWWVETGRFGSVFNWKRFPAQSMFFLESISGQVPAGLFWGVRNWVKYYGEG